MLSHRLYLDRIQHSLHLRARFYRRLNQRPCQHLRFPPPSSAQPRLQLAWLALEHRHGHAVRARVVVHALRALHELRFLPTGSLAPHRRQQARLGQRRLCKGLWGHARRGAGHHGPPGGAAVVRRRA